MKTTRYIVDQWSGELVPVNPGTGQPLVSHRPRPVTQAYVDGFVREVYVDTGEVVLPPKYRPPLKVKTTKRHRGKKWVPTGAHHPNTDLGRLQRKRTKLNRNFAALEVQRLRFWGSRKPLPAEGPLW